jgi:hypothetical protein
MAFVQCTHIIRGTRVPCKLKEGHRGGHSSVAFSCDNCGQTFRGRPHVWDTDAQFCFLCSGGTYHSGVSHFDWKTKKWHGGGRSRRKV